MNIFSSEILQQMFWSHYLLFTALFFIASFIITYIIIPKVILVSYLKELTVPVNSRSAHIIPTPSFGGVAFFTTLILMVSLIQSMLFRSEGNNLIAGLTVLFMVGLKDDLIISSPVVKIIGQLMAIAFIIFLPQLQITSLHGFLGIYEVHPILSIVMALVLMLAIINAYNLIDGIDGLAGIIGIIICSIYAILFVLSGQNFFFLICVTIVGILTAFLRYNLSSGINKIFMGDSGSLIIGFLIGFLTLRYLTIDPFIILNYEFKAENRIVFILAILFIPTFDTTRIVFARLLKKKNPFIADRNHAHHILIDLGLSHVKASIILGFLNVLIVFLFLLLGRYYSSMVMVPVMGILFLFFSYLFFAFKTRKIKMIDFNFPPGGLQVKAKADKEKMVY
jgi:UDP-N-acetylmuramyl pentapeptide phosphotransferase/UDP-N-acetylglucosamine-1-phosphate transferase